MVVGNEALILVVHIIIVEKLIFIITLQPLQLPQLIKLVVLVVPAVLVQEKVNGIIIHLKIDPLVELVLAVVIPQKPKLETAVMAVKVEIGEKMEKMEKTVILIITAILVIRGWKEPRKVLRYKVLEI
jgi:hypothetical protein